MTDSIGTLMVDVFATSHYTKSQLQKTQQSLHGDQEQTGENDIHLTVLTRATHGHSHGSASMLHHSDSTELVRHRVVSQVLELGIVVHSVIIGISLGASESPKTIRPLVAALTFHQFFEGMGLGGCISQAKFKSRAVIIMAVFLTDNPASSGILIYMALVDLLAADFMNPKLENKAAASVSLVLGAALMSLLAIWA
ncbi:hypothetical protein V6N13_005348 [Hibiscus sabdariffa]